MHPSKGGHNGGQGWSRKDGQEETGRPEENWRLSVEEIRKSKRIKKDG